MLFFSASAKRSVVGAAAALRVDCEPRYRVIIDGVMSQAESHRHYSCRAVHEISRI